MKTTTEESYLESRINELEVENEELKIKLEAFSNRLYRATKFVYYFKKKELITLNALNKIADLTDNNRKYKEWSNTELWNVAIDAIQAIKDVDLKLTSEMIDE